MRSSRILVALGLAVGVLGMATGATAASRSAATGAIDAQCTPAWVVNISPPLTETAQPETLRFSGSLSGADCPLGPGTVSGRLKSEGNANCGSEDGGTIFSGKLKVVWADASVSTLVVHQFAGIDVPTIFLLRGRAAGVYQGDQIRFEQSHSDVHHQNCFDNKPETKWIIPGPPASGTEPLTFIQSGS